MEAASLFQVVERYNGQQYGQLKALKGYTFALDSSHGAGQDRQRPLLTITFLHIQSDPFAPGSQVRLDLRFPSLSLQEMLDHPSLAEPVTAAPCGKEQEEATRAVLREVRRVAAEDHLLRVWRAALERVGGGDSVWRAMEVLRPSPHVLPRSSVSLQTLPSSIDSGEAGTTVARFFGRAKLPGHGRRIDAHGICRILSALEESLHHLHQQQQDGRELLQAMNDVHDQEWLRAQLHGAGLAAFVADGATLPRSAGNSELPMGSSTRLGNTQQQEQPVLFASPPSLRRTFLLPCSGREVSGMGLPRGGLTLIAGGGFHGKSTLLRAIELGIYNHIMSDGRAFVVTDPTATKIRAEDRRSVQGVNIEAFISNLPMGKRTDVFATTEASGSTSQAANMMEALECGASTLLIDEDTSATNLMFRDEAIAALVPRTQEPITPLEERIAALVKDRGIAVVMVVGGSGQYLPHADVVVVLNQYSASDATADAKAIVKKFCSKCSSVLPKEASSPFGFVNRHLDARRTFGGLNQGSGGGDGSYRHHHHHSPRVKASGAADKVRFGDCDIELALVEQLVEEGQLHAIAQCLAMCYDRGEGWVEQQQQQQQPSMVSSSVFKGVPCALTAVAQQPSLLPSGDVGAPPAHRMTDFARLIHHCETLLRQSHLELQTPSAYMPSGFTSLPRVMEIAAAFNRMRCLRIR